MVIRPLLKSDFSDYDVFVQGHPGGSLFQSRLWQEYQAQAFGLKSFILAGWEDQKIINSALVFEYPLPLGKCYWYCPRGPLFSPHPVENQHLIEQIRQAMRTGLDWENFVSPSEKRKTIFFRFDPLVQKSEGVVPYLGDTAVRATVSHQPATTLVLDLTPDETALLAQMKEKGRYNIRLAKKKGVAVETGRISELYPLILETGKRDGFSVHRQSVYETMLQVFGKNALLLVAKHDQTVIAGGIFLFFGSTATYYYGASANQYRNLMAPYLVQWEAIREARRRGCMTYDLLGIADEGIEKHPLSGVTDFKRKFGGKCVAYVGGLMIPQNQFWTGLYHLYKKLR